MPESLQRLFEGPHLFIAQSVLKDIMLALASRPAESGGILLGPVGDISVSHFVFDEGGSCTGTTYSPDHASLQKRLDEEWLPNGLDMKGFAHSHPAGMDRLSTGDFEYIKRLLQNPNNADMTYFYAPIVIPEEFRMVLYGVSRDLANDHEIKRLYLI